MSVSLSTIPNVRLAISSQLASINFVQRAEFADQLVYCHLEPEKYTSISIKFSEEQIIVNLNVAWLGQWALQTGKVTGATSYSAFAGSFSQSDSKFVEKLIAIVESVLARKTTNTDMGYKKISGTIHTLNDFLDNEAANTSALRKNIVEEIYEHSRAATQLADDLMNLDAIEKVRAAGHRFGDRFMELGANPEKQWMLYGVSANRVVLFGRYSRDKSINLEEWPNPKFIKLPTDGTENPTK